MRPDILIFCGLMIFTGAKSDISNDKPKDYRIIPPKELGGSQYRHPSVHGSMLMTLDIPRNQLIVGARNQLLRLRLDNLELFEEHGWAPKNSTREICLAKGHTEDICHNFVRVLLVHKNKVFTCGTNAFAPECTWRHATHLRRIEKSVSGVAVCPYNPHDNSTAVMSSNGDLYSSTVVDPTGRDPAIYRIIGPSAHLRTVPHSKWLNDPDFVAAYDVDEYVYFFFREIAVEYINCGKVVYSRVARVCKNDAGGRLLLRDNWTTFVKARLNCSRGSEFPFYYNEIQSVYYLQQRKVFYAIFSTSPNSISGSAVCSFSMAELDVAFSGPYKYQSSSESAWRSVPNPNPTFRCDSSSNEKRSRSASAQRMVFEAQRYQMMDRAVQSQTNVPIITVDNVRWRHMVVDEVKAKHHSEFQVLFVADGHGTIQKIITLPQTNGSCIVEELQLGTKDKPVLIRSFKLHSEEGMLYVGSEGKIFSIPVERCHRFHTREMCMNAKDPYCGWDTQLSRCTRAPHGQSHAHHWHQDISSCPILEYPVNGGWTQWSDWQECPHVGEGRHGDVCLCRSRSCTDPKPALGGDPCNGQSLQIANCTVNGGWTPWSEWSACSQSCDVAVRTRQRSCSNPEPRFGGRVCVGATRDETYCHNNPPCPVPTRPPLDGNWSPWTPWSECSAPCGGGVEVRYRTCTNPPPADGGSPCIGNDEKWRKCNNVLCDEVRKSSSWTPWLKTNNTKDGHYQERYRFVCKANVAESRNLRVSNMKSESRFCPDNKDSCNDGTVSHIPDVDGGWSMWSGWTRCNAPCDGGTQWRRRQCNAPYPSGGGRDCEGHGLEARECNIHSCQGMWSCWSQWSACSKTCGAGTRWRTRLCISRVEGQEFNIPCEGKDQQEEACDLSSCSGFDGWEEWTLWSECSTDNIQQRKRKCKLAFPDAHQCSGRSVEKRMCSYNVISDISIGEVQGQGKQNHGSGGFQLYHLIIVGLAAFVVGGTACLGVCLYCQRRRRRARGHLQLKHLEKRDFKPTSSYLGSSQSDLALNLNNAKLNFYDTSSLKKEHKYMTVKEAALHRNSLMRTGSMRTNLSLDDL